MSINSPKWPYNTTAWRKLRALHLNLHPFCEHCLAAGKHKTANTVDHRIAISQGGDPFPSHDGLASYCAGCHSAKTARSGEAGAVRTWKPRKGCNPDGSPLDRAHPWLGGTGTITKATQDRRMPTDLGKSAIPLTIVCGAPGSGKSTYVREHARDGDVIICLDTIMQKISGKPEHQTPPWCITQALDTRNAMLRALATASRHAEGARAWFIVSAPSPRDREKWAARLGGRLHVMDTPSAECVRRIKADGSRAGRQDRMITAALSWWAANPHLVRKKSLRAESLEPPSHINFELVQNPEGPENGGFNG